MTFMGSNFKRQKSRFYVVEMTSKLYFKLFRIFNFLFQTIPYFPNIIVSIFIHSCLKMQLNTGKEALEAVKEERSVVFKERTKDSMLLEGHISCLQARYEVRN